jgi:hypothetical protein
MAIRGAVDQPDHKLSKIDVKKRLIANIRAIHLLHTQCFTSDFSVHMMQPRVFSVQCLARLPILMHDLERGNVGSHKVMVPCRRSQKLAISSSCSTMGDQAWTSLPTCEILSSKAGEGVEEPLVQRAVKSLVDSS